MNKTWRMERIGENNNNLIFVIKPHSIKPLNLKLLLAKDSLYLPSLGLLPRDLLFANPYPESLNPFETHEQLSISELTAASFAQGTPFHI